LDTNLKRHEQLDKLFKSLYEDHALSALSDDRYRKLSGEYEIEQTELDIKIAKLRNEITEIDTQDASLDEFLALVHKHTQIRKLTKALLNQFIDSIVVHQAEKIDGRHHQQLNIYYNYVGMIELADASGTPTPVVQMQTRKGVLLTSKQPHLDKAS
jgi:hypothetical protein